MFRFRDGALPLRHGALLPALGPALRGALALVSPVDCAGCGTADRELCEPCRDRLRAAPLVDSLPDGTPFISALEYSGVVRDVILEFKQAGRWRLGREFGPALRAAVDVCLSVSPSPSPSLPLPPSGGEVPLVLAVPSSASGARRRGYDPVRILLKAAEIRPVRQGLVIRGGSGSQKSLSRSERIRRRRGSMRCPRSLAGHAVLIVDDVATSGATLVEAARAARAAGAVVLATCCVAATPLVVDQGQ